MITDIDLQNVDSYRFTTALSVLMLRLDSHSHGPRGATWITYGDAVKLAHQLYYRRHPVEKDAVQNDYDI